VFQSEPAGRFRNVPPNLVLSALLFFGVTATFAVESAVEYPGEGSPFLGGLDSSAGEKATGLLASQFGSLIRLNDGVTIAKHDSNGNYRPVHI